MIDYDSLVQKSLRSVVRTVLENAEREGVPENHQFVLTFLPTYPGVLCPDYLIEKHKDEITIILRDDEYRDLVVADQYFKVTVYINEKTERLVVPFESLLCFGDPFAKFGLHFEIASQETKEKSEVISEADNVVSLDAFRKKQKK